jgi:prepilin-type N-terminal cleavage/methylation domain-containing protein
MDTNKTSATSATQKTGSRRCPLRRFIPQRVQNAFTLIELLLVIAIVSLLVGIVLPGLATARRLAKQSREFSAAKQVMTGFTAYANDFRGYVLPGLASRQMVSTNPGQPGVLRAFDDAGNPIAGPEAQRYPWRLAPYLDYQLRGLYDDQNIFDRYREGDRYVYRVSLSPSLGINAEFVGGKADPGLAFTPASLRQWGRFYLAKLDDTRRPERLIGFATARGPDYDGGVVTGYFLVDAPNRERRNWSTQPFARESEPADFGYVDPRHFNKAISVMIDGHAEAYSIRELDDMTRWANQATKTDWLLAPLLP